MGEEEDADESAMEKEFNSANTAAIGIFSKLEDEFAKRAPKNPKTSARGKYNRRKIWLAHALQEMSYAIDTLFAQEGVVYKRAEAEVLKNELERFMAVTGLTPAEEPPLTQEELDHLMDMFTSKPKNEI